MSRKKNNHYLSQCISKNFIENSNQTFWEYNCSTKSNPVQKNINRLFSKRRLWGEGLENTIGKHMENIIAPILKKYSTCQVDRIQHPSSDGTEEVQFNGFEICEEDERKALSKLLLQTSLLQRSNANGTNLDTEKNLQNFFEFDANVLKNIPLCVIEINPLMKAVPLILVDGMSFGFVAPNMPQKMDSIGHICFIFPISTARFLLWGNRNDLDYFALKYQNIHFLNLCRIEQSGKKCRIATQDKKYLDLLIPQIEPFSSGNSAVNVTLCRDWE